MNYFKSENTHLSYRNRKAGAVILGILILSGIAMNAHVKSDKYVNGKRLAQAEDAARKSNLSAAIDLYGTVYKISAHHKQKARDGIKSIISTGPLKAANQAELAHILTTLNAFDDPPLHSLPADVYELALTRIRDNNVSATLGDNVNTHKLLHAVDNLNPTGEDLSRLDIALINAINKSDPNNLEAATELAESLYTEGNLVAAKSALVPVKDRLADSESARILGQIYISEGDNKNAYPLLSAYISTRLVALQEAEENFTTMQSSLWDAEFNKLNNGLGPQDFYDTYELKSDDEKQLYVDQYIGEKINDDLLYQISLETYREASTIVPVVMDFGVLQLRAAEAMSTEEDRTVELEAAEKTFLSIRNIVGDTDDYKIYLGQVYFWLGKQDEGQILFDEVLAANNRSANSLLSIASTLRILGKVGLSTQYTLEVYENSADEAMRFYAANLMHLLSDDIEEKVKWLKRADPKQPYIQGALMENQGHLAVQKGDSSKAAFFYEKAIEISKTQIEDASTYNNTALMYFALHRVTGDKAAYKNGVELMSKAVELLPNDSILLSNAASTLIVNSLFETVGDSIDYTYLQTSPTITSVSYYYSSTREKSALRTKISPHEDWKKAIDYLERGVLLSPNKLSNYLELYAIYYFMHDEAGLASVANRITKNQVDISVFNKRYMDFINGVDREATLAKLVELELHYKSLLENDRIGEATRGVLHDYLAENYIQQISLGKTSVADKAVQQAELADRHIPSSSTKATLSKSLLIRASIDAATTFPKYKTIRDNSVRSLSDNVLAILALGQSGDIANWLKSNRDILRAIDIEAGEYKKFPESTDPANWALFNSVGHPFAESLGNAIKRSSMRDSMQKISKIVSPLSGQSHIDQYWMSKISDNTGVDATTFEALAAQSVNLPREWLQ